MKKILGYIGTYFFYYIGDISCKVSYIKIRNKYLGNMLLGETLFNIYQKSMDLSIKIQDWGGLEKPWKHAK